MVIAASPPPSYLTSHLDRSQKAPNPQYAHFAGQDFRIEEPLLLRTVFEWMAERHAIFERRFSGMSAPWTTDRVMAEHPFCNVYRLLDKGTQYLVERVINGGGAQDVVEVTFRTILFRMFNKIDTWELLVRELGPELTYSDFNVERYTRVLEDAMDEAEARGTRLTLYTSAHQVSAPSLGEAKYFQNHIKALSAMMEAKLPQRLAKCEYLRDAFEIIRLCPGYGDFLANQLACDLALAPNMKYTEETWVAGGPGSGNCLRKIFGPAVNSYTSEAMAWLQSIQNEHWERIGYAPSLRDPATGLVLRQGVTIVDIEHSLCEVEKWTRVAMPWLKGTKTELKKNGSSGAWGGKKNGVTQCIPNKWMSGFVAPPLPSDDEGEDEEMGDEDDGFVNGEDGDTYEVSHIIKQRGNGGSFLVRWVGYGPADDMWLPVDELERSAPDVLAKWRAIQDAIDVQVRRVRTRKGEVKANITIKRIATRKVTKKVTRKVVKRG